MKEPELKNKAEIVLRNHLLRCFKDVVKEFPAISHMPKEEAVDYLLRLRQDGKVVIKLNTVDDLIKTQIHWVGNKKIPWTEA